MIETQRTNIVPPKLLLLCLGLMIFRLFFIAYSTYFPSESPANTIVWQSAVPLDRNRKDLLTKPDLYYFCDRSDKMQEMISKVGEGFLFNNRQVVQFLKNNFRLTKIEHQNEDNEVVAKLRDQLSVYMYPTITITLVDGTRVNSCSWQTDRGFMVFMEDALRDRYAIAARRGLLTGNYHIACEALATLKQLPEHVNVQAAFLSSDDPAIYQYIALRHLKRDAEAQTVLQQALIEQNKTYGEKRTVALQFLLGQITQSQYVAQIKDTSTPTRIHYLCAEKNLFDGNLKLAKTEFHLAVANKNDLFSDDYKYACTELKALGETIPSEEKEDKDPV